MQEQVHQLVVQGSFNHKKVSTTDFSSTFLRVNFLTSLQVRGQGSNQIWRCEVHGPSKAVQVCLLRVEARPASCWPWGACSARVESVLMVGIAASRIITRAMPGASASILYSSHTFFPLNLSNTSTAFRNLTFHNKQHYGPTESTYVEKSPRLITPGSGKSGKIFLETFRGLWGLRTLSNLDLMVT